jgi:hypothetical protein
MYSDVDTGDVIEDVARIHPALDRLRQLLTSATILDLKASAGGYWADHQGDGESPTPSDSEQRAS